MIQRPSVVVGAVECNRLFKECRCMIEVLLGEGDEPKVGEQNAGDGALG